jgi:hypothetical protein
MSRREDLRKLRGILAGRCIEPDIGTGLVLGVDNWVESKQRRLLMEVERKQISKAPRGVSA